MNFAENEQLRYELKARRTGRWEIRDLVDAYAEAGGRAYATTNMLQTLEERLVQRARDLLGRGEAEGVMLVRSRIRNGYTTETTVFSDERDARAGVAGVAVTLGKVEAGAVPACTTVADLCGRSGYRLAGQVLRSFLERNGITAFELFHLATHQRTLAENRTLIPGTIERVATAQAAGDPVALAAAKERLTGLVEALRREAERLADRQLPTLRDAKFEEMASAAIALGPADSAAFRVGVAFSRSLARDLGMPHRLRLVTACLETPPAAPGMTILDTFLAGVFDDPSATVGLLGHRADRAQILLRLADLAQGRSAGAGAKPEALAVGSAVAQRLLPVTSASLWARICRDLDRGEPLSQFEPRLERERLGMLRSELLPAAPTPLKPRIETALKRRSETLRRVALEGAY